MASGGASGRALQRKWDDRRMQEHRQRLGKIKSSVDNSPPKEFVHLKQKLRKRQLEEDRWRTVDRHNRELLTRMHQIMHSTGRVNHRNVDWKPKKSLGYVKRQEEMSRMQRENQAILKRIQTVRPQYNVRQWESDFRAHQSRSRSIALLPPLEPQVLVHKHTDRSMRTGGASLHLPPISDSTQEQRSLETKEEEIDVDG